MTLTETPTGPAPDRSPSRDDPGTTHCPVRRRCYTPDGRQLYCSTACRKTAFRRRHEQPGPTVTVPAARPRREITVYECDCGDRYLGEQRCQGCGTFARRVGIGGACPNCDEPVAHFRPARPGGGQHDQQITNPHGLHIS